jgi:hypothetical protein
MPQDAFDEDAIFRLVCWNEPDREYVRRVLREELEATLKWAFDAYDALPPAGDNQEEQP